MSEPHENESHAELEKWVAAGTSVIVSDDLLPGGRFQLAGTVMGGEIVLVSWQQDDTGDWRSGACVIIKRGGLPKLADLLRRTGYHVMPVPNGG